MAEPPILLRHGTWFVPALPSGRHFHPQPRYSRNQHHGVHAVRAGTQTFCMSLRLVPPQIP
jgi:hypothetical protein